MKVVVVFLAVIAFIICLYLGLHLGGLTGLAATSTPTVTSIFSPTLTGNQQQQTVVLIQADDLSSSSPRLVGIWLVFYYADNPKLTLLLLYPSLNENNQVKASELGQKFALTANGDLSPDFLQVLHSYNFHSTGTLITDNNALAHWIDWLGGIPYHGSPTLLTGSEVVARMPAANPSNLDTGSWMKEVTDGVCTQLNILPASANWKNLTNTMQPAHFNTDLNIDGLIANWNNLKNSGEDISCEVVIPH